MIGLTTIENAVSLFVETFLGIEYCTIKVEQESIDESVKRFLEHEKLFNKNSPIRIGFTDDVVSELCVFWKMSKKQVEEKLKASVQ